MTQRERLATWKARPNHKDWTLRTNNPHIDQAFMGNLPTHHPPPSTSFSRTLSPDAPRMAYQRRKGQKKTVLHWGQRKLLFSEIEFLTLYARKQQTVVYAGAAPGTHVDYLCELFPSAHFILVDPEDFTVKPGPQVTIRQEFFTDKVAAEYAGKNVLFISDIRTANPSKMSSAEVEKHVSRDQEWQQTWHGLMRPIASMFKFRLPWAAGKTPYLDGTVFLPVWGPQTTSETRLVVECDAKKRDWDNKLYEDQMFFFNTVTRQQCYPHNVVDHSEGLDHCYDCSAEIFVLAAYLRSSKGTAPPSKSTNLIEQLSDTETKQILKMSSRITQVIARGRRLLTDPQPLPGHRRMHKRGHKLRAGMVSMGIL